MECLIDYIGIKGCSAEIPESGIYINSLPGISLESIDKIADEEQVTYQGAWEDIQEEAAIRFLTDFIEELNKCYRLTAYCDYESLICLNRRRLITAWRYLLGNQIMLFTLFSPRINRFTTVGLEDAERLKNHYQVEYEKSLSQAAKLVDVSSCELCCGGNPEYVTWIP